MTLEERVAELEKQLQTHRPGGLLRSYEKAKAEKEKAQEKRSDTPRWKAFTWDGKPFEGAFGKAGKAGKGQWIWKDGQPKLRIEVPDGDGKEAHGSSPRVIEIPQLHEKLRERIKTAKPRTKVKPGRGKLSESPTWNGEHRRELEELMREMRSEVENMRAQMAKLREELEALPKDSAR